MNPEIEKILKRIQDRVGVIKDLKGRPVPPTSVINHLTECNREDRREIKKLENKPGQPN